MNILKDSFYLTLSKGIRSLVMMIVVMIMTRINSLETYGTYRQLITLSSIILAIAPLGIPISVSYYYKNIDTGLRSRLISNSATICFICGLASSMIFILFRSQISNSLNIAEIDKYLLGFSFYIVILVTSSFIENLFISADMAKKFSICNSIYYAFFLITMITVVFRYNALSVIISVMAVMEFIRFIGLFLFIVKKLDVRFSLDINFIKEQLKYSTVVGLVGIMQVLSNSLDKLLISGYFSAEEFAIYSTGTMEIPIIELATISLATVALPHMSKAFNTDHDIKALLSIWNKITITGAAVIFPIFFILICYNRGYIGFLFSDKYFPCIPVFLIHLLRLPLSCTVFGNMLLVMRKQKVTVYNMLISIIINLICNILLIPLLGMAGAALSGVVMHISIILLQLFQISRYSKVKMLSLLPYKQLLKIMGIAFVTTFPIYFLSTIFSFHEIVKFFLFGTLSFFVSIFTLKQLGLINFSERLSHFKMNKTEFNRTKKIEQF